MNIYIYHLKNTCMYIVPTNALLFYFIKGKMTSTYVAFKCSQNDELRHVFLWVLELENVPAGVVRNERN